MKNPEYLTVGSRLVKGTMINIKIIVINFLYHIRYSEKDVQKELARLLTYCDTFCL